MCRLLFISLLLGACGTSGIGARLAPVAGFSRGAFTQKDLYPRRHNTTLTAAGATIQLVAAPSRGCEHRGYVTGIGTVTRLDESLDEVLEQARNDARNHAANAGMSLIVVDATETWWNQIASEAATRVVWASVHGRAFQCMTDPR